ncbi:MAG: hypothetical protein FJ403_23065 [Verrucomicrobia bacterium]|nr:hypothetical protein [Verrucomicrobiota bacterium]
MDLADGPDFAHAGHAATQVEGWRITPFDLSPVDHAIAEQFARHLLIKELIPDDELNDALILAETSLAGIPVLVTSDQHLLGIDEDALMIAFPAAKPCWSR